MRVKILNHSVYDNYTVASQTENISNVVDKLIRLTAKITESYASDIVYDIEALKKAVENHAPYHKLLIFHECGVRTKDFPRLNNHVVVDDETARELSERVYDSLQFWELVHDPDNMFTKLERKDVYVCLV